MTSASRHGSANGHATWTVACSCGEKFHGPTRDSATAAYHNHAREDR